MTTRRSFFHTLTFGLFAAPALAIPSQVEAQVESPTYSGHRTLMLNGVTLVPSDYAYMGGGWVTFNFRLKGGAKPDVVTIPFVSGGHLRSVVYTVQEDWLPALTPVRVFDPADLPPDY